MHGVFSHGADRIISSFIGNASAGSSLSKKKEAGRSVALFFHPFGRIAAPDKLIPFPFS
jgi:hypothetical protein